MSGFDVGDTVGGHYRLLSQLGVGAMGRVFLAEHTSLGSRVAVKVLKSELLADADFRTRFQREAQAVASIDHPNVAKFLDLVLDGPIFLVMEYASGPNLQQVILKEGRLKPARATNIALRLCWAMHAVHAAGIIHRDLKPANVVLVSDVEKGEIPKLIDFGLAKLGLPSQERLTRAGQILGTPQYMAPEQIAGREVDARCDVYALGCVLYEMLVGHPLFPDCVSNASVLTAQVQRTPTPARSLVEEVPVALVPILDRALAKLPIDRYASMIEMAHALATPAPRGLFSRLASRLRK